MCLIGSQSPGLHQREFKSLTLRHFMSMTFMEEWKEPYTKMDELRKKMELKKKRVPTCIVSKKKRKKKNNLEG